MVLSLPVAFVAGLFSFMSPCVLPLVPTYLLYLGGERGRPLVNALFFIVGFSLIFLLLGLPFTLIGALLKDYKTQMAQVGGALVVLFGLYLLGLRIPFMAVEAKMSYRGDTSRPLGAVLLGVTFAAGWTPCIGPILGSILMLTTVQGNASGMGYLFAYILGLAVPFFIVALFADRAVAWIRRNAQYTRWAEIAAGILMIVVGILLITGIFTDLNQFFIKITPSWMWSRL